MNSPCAYTYPLDREIVCERPQGHGGKHVCTIAWEQAPDFDVDLFRAEVEDDKTTPLSFQRLARNHLTRAERRMVHSLYASGRTQTEIAKRLGVTQATISNVITGRTWRQPDDDECEELAAAQLMYLAALDAVNH